MTIEKALSLATTWIIRIVSIALLLVFAVTLAQQYGFRVPMVPTMSGLELLYMCAGWAFINGRIKLG